VTTAQQVPGAQAAAVPSRTVSPGAWLEALGALEDRVLALETANRMLVKVVAELVSDVAGEYPRDDEEAPDGNR
jgi:hypothetical protein